MHTVYEVLALEPFGGRGRGGRGGELGGGGGGVGREYEEYVRVGAGEIMTIENWFEGEGVDVGRIWIF